MNQKSTYYSNRYRSSTNSNLSCNHTLSSWEDTGIILPPDTAGEVRTTCPQCSPGRRKSHDECLSVNVSTGLFYCHHCGWRGSLRRSRRASVRAAPPPRRRPEGADAQRKRERLKQVWHQARPITSDAPAGRYLTRRGLWSWPVPYVLRFHPALPYYHDNGRRTHHPALVAVVQAPDDQAVSVHRIYLTPDGRKALVPSPKKLMPSPTTIRGAAIRLDPAGECLAVTEGVETALAVRLSASIPAWAAISAHGMESLILPDVVRLVVIAADHDVNGVGERAAKVLAQRLLREDRTKIVKVLKPPTPGTDWADGVKKEG